MLCVKANGDIIIAYPYSPTDLIRANPNTSFPAGPLSPETLAEYDVFPVQTVSPPVFNSRTQRLVEQQPARIAGVWAQRWAVEPLPSDEIAALDAQQAASVRADRNARLAACDWTQVLDSTVDVPAWGVYRQALRDVPQQAGFPWEINWPVAP